MAMTITHTIYLQKTGGLGWHSPAGVARASVRAVVVCLETEEEVEGYPDEEATNIGAGLKRHANI